MTNSYDIGIAGYGLYMPSEFVTATDLEKSTGLSSKELNQLGISRKCKPGPEDQPVVMARKAAEDALAKSEAVSPDSVDVVIFTGEEYKDYIAQTAAIRIQEELGCKNAYSFDLVGQGVTLIQGIRIARDMMIGDESVNTVLLAGGTRNVDMVDPAREDTRFLLPYSASGSAMIIKRGTGINELLDFSIMVDSDMADEVYVPGGGTEQPFAEDNLDSSIMFFQCPNPEKVSNYLETRFPGKIAECILKAANGRDIGYLALRHMPPGTRDIVLNDLKLEPGQSAVLVEYGHHGTNDPVISLDQGIKQGKINGGDFVVLASAGIGFTYAAVSVDWKWNIENKLLGNNTNPTNFEKQVYLGIKNGPTRWLSALPDPACREWLSHVFNARR